MPQHRTDFGQARARLGEIGATYSLLPIFTGGEGEIRTHGGIATTPVFKTGAFNRSATSPSSYKSNACNVFYKIFIATPARMAINHTATPRGSRVCRLNWRPMPRYRP